MDRGRGFDGADFERFGTVPTHGKVIIDSQGRARGISRQDYFTAFALLPSTSVSATTDHLTIESGTGTEVIARAAKGGVNLKSQATTPADGDNVLLTPSATGTGLYCQIGAQKQPRFETRVALTSIAEVFASFGFNENITDADPTGTAGEGAMFLFDPTEEVTTGLTTAEHANWILAHKVNGVDTFTATEVPVVAGVDYELVVQQNEDLTCSFYINGVLVGTGPALTSGDTVGAFIGIELTATPAGQKDVDVRYLGVSRLIGG